MRAWEDAYRPLRVLDREMLFVADAPAGMSQIAPAQRALLFIHGTFSRVSAAFSDLPQDASFLAALRERYGEHLYGFDHATLATGVATNVMQFYERLAPGDHHFDILCHSRGGLVARALRDLSEEQLRSRFRLDAERGHYGADLRDWGEHWRIPAGVRVKVGRIVFAATPNQCTVLAQPTHLKSYLDLLMTATNLLPEVVDVSVDALLETARLLISDVMPQLPGLDDQQPQSTLIPLLQRSPGACDAAIQADYEPPAGVHAVMHLADSTMDFVFGDEKNDLVVPTEGVSRWAGGDFSPGRILTFGKEIGVHHSSLFRQPETRRNLLAWLT